jgi:NADPH-dependent ferric siderophore reductase
MPDDTPRERSLPEWQFRCRERRQVTPNMLRIVLQGADLAEFSYIPGQALRLVLPHDGFRTCERDYTIRNLDRAAGTIELDVFLHGDTPGPRWARDIRPGDSVIGRGPRSRIRLLPGRAWYLLAGDDTCIPAILHMLEALPGNARAEAFIEVTDLRDRQSTALPDGVRLHWLQSEPHEPSPLLQAVEELPFQECQGQICLIGQTATVQALRRRLIARGYSKEDIAAEGYWRPGKTGGIVHDLGQ